MKRLPEVRDKYEQVHEEKRRQGVNNTKNLTDLEHAVPWGCFLHLHHVFHHQKGYFHDIHYE